MKVQVKFFANVQQWIGKEEIQLQLDPSGVYKVRDLLREIADREKMDLSALLKEDLDDSRAKVRVIINGKGIHTLDGLDTVIQDGDQIALFPLLGGG
jgi:sulfur-carrier protein